MKHQFDLRIAGKPLNEAKMALIMLHGRGSTAENILSISEHFNVDEFALMAPQATNNTWYPQSFMAKEEENQPWLNSALETIHQTVERLNKNGIQSENIYFFGFSQGACLTLEYLARNAQKYAGAVAIIGGLIGEKIIRENYNGNFENTSIFIGTSNPDFHVPIERVYATENILKEMNAQIHLKVYDNFPHTIHQDQIDIANKLIFNES